MFVVLHMVLMLSEYYLNVTIGPANFEPSFIQRCEECVSVLYDFFEITPVALVRE
jgi:hypothetical protein